MLEPPELVHKHPTHLRKLRSYRRELTNYIRSVTRYRRELGQGRMAGGASVGRCRMWLAGVGGSRTVLDVRIHCR